MERRQPKRTYDSSLRAGQASDTRSRILAAFAEQVVEGGFTDFSIERVAKRAGVSPRTVYHHFPKREDLLDAITRWLDDSYGARGLPEPVAVEDFLDFLPVVFRSFDAGETYIRAQLVTDLGRDIRQRGRSRRRPVIEAIVAQALPGRAPEELTQATSIIHYLTSSEAWRSLKDESGMTGEEAGKAVAWAIGALFDNLRMTPHGADRPNNSEDDDAAAS